jgi:hypothetical protein
MNVYHNFMAWCLDVRITFSGFCMLQVLNPLDAVCNRQRTDAVCINQLKNAKHIDEGLLQERPDVKIFLPFRFLFYRPEELFRPHSYNRYLGTACLSLIWNLSRFSGYTCIFGFQSRSCWPSVLTKKYSRFYFCGVQPSDRRICQRHPWANFMNEKIVILIIKYLFSLFNNVLTALISGVEQWLWMMSWKRLWRKQWWHKKWLMILGSLWQRCSVKLHTDMLPFIRLKMYVEL